MQNSQWGRKLNVRLSDDKFDLNVSWRAVKFLLLLLILILILLCSEAGRKGSGV
jgi:hypothetical protein